MILSRYGSGPNLLHGMNVLGISKAGVEPAVHEPREMSRKKIIRVLEMSKSWLPSTQRLFPQGLLIHLLAGYATIPHLLSYGIHAYTYVFS